MHTKPQITRSNAKIVKSAILIATPLFVVSFILLGIAIAIVGI